MNNNSYISEEEESKLIKMIDIKNMQSFKINNIL